MDIVYSYVVQPNGPGAWAVKFFEDGVEMGGGVFPAVPESEWDGDVSPAYLDALEEGENYVACRGDF